MFYEKYAGKIVADLCGVVLSIGLINLIYEFTRDDTVLHGLDSVDGFCLLALVALTCAFVGYHALAFRVDLAVPSEKEAAVPMTATQVITLYLIDLTALSSLAAMFGVLSIGAKGPHLPLGVLSYSALFAAVWHVLIALWHRVRWRRLATDVAYHLAFAAWYAVFSAIFALARLNGTQPEDAINLYGLLWVFGFATGVGFLYFGRFRKIVARGIAEVE